MRKHGNNRFRWTKRVTLVTKQGPYTAAKGRRFATTMAGAFGVFAVIAIFRHREVTERVFIALFFIMLVSGFAFPARLEPVERAWMRFAHALSRITTPIFMGIVYFVVLTPVALLRRMGSNPMVHKSVEDSFWVSRTRADKDAARRRMERQF